MKALMDVNGKGMDRRALGEGRREMNSDGRKKLMDMVVNTAEQ